MLFCWQEFKNVENSHIYLHKCSLFQKIYFEYKFQIVKVLIFYHVSQFFTSQFLFIELDFLKNLNYFDLWIALTGLLFKPFPGRNKAPTIQYILTHFIDWAMPARPKACNDISCFIKSTSDKMQIIISKLFFVGLVPYLCPVLRRGVIFRDFFFSVKSEP